MSDDARDKIESLLDDALANYSRQEPRPGLEGRVLERVRAETARRVAFPRWGWAIPAAACLLWAGVLWTRHTARPVQIAVTHVAAVPVAAPLQPVIRAVVNHPKRKRKVLAKLAQFPAPAAVTNEERALLAFVAHAPKEAQESLIEAQQHGLEPIRIEEIKIQPLP